MKKTFEITHDGRRILVENRWFEGEKLFVDGELQDENLGLSLRGNLTGKLKHIERIKSIKVTLGGFLAIQCKIFIDNELVYASGR